MPNEREPREPVRVLLDENGPLLVEGPVEVTMPDGSTALSDRFLVAVCVCRRTRTPPWCDTSHRRHSRGRTAPSPSEPA
ncbi:CDGSH iron-sulfur domain-containing protein [Streptomyces sp. NPDC005803]|uniref:CDGSH iron-sulfur domain-containing protein n=1 Tax=Streptomyces sp. NPDC005803 TaxID=3154297 RepID=UPI0033C700D6